MRDLRRRIGREEFDYQALMAALSEYANPRDRVTALLRRGDIIRVKKGLYVLGDELRRRPYSREILANLGYGPSFVSLDSALSFHGFIPERALADKVRDDRGHELRTRTDAARYLFDDLRIEKSGFEQMDPAVVDALARGLGSREFFHSVADGYRSRSSSSCGELTGSWTQQ